MTERSVTHATFVVERSYDASPARVFAAFAEPAIDASFVQDNHTRSMTGVLRGLHFQNPQSQGKLVRVVSWYDNEWGFSNRMVDTAAAMAKLG